MKVKNQLQSLFSTEGLEFLGVSGLEMDDDFEAYLNWLSKDLHAGMKFMEENQNIRLDPGGVLAGVRSAITFACFYPGSEHDLKKPALYKPNIARYAQFKDYHKVLKKKAEAVVENLQVSFPEGDFRVCVDSVPLFERSLARRSKTGFIGKNTMFIHYEKGSYCLLGVILTTIDMSFLEKVEILSRGNRDCGHCRRCVVNCPTGALDGDYHLDANKCLSYWTIEHRGPVPLEYWPWFKWFYFGCDLCQAVCPYNQKGSSNESALPKSQWASLDFFDLASMSQKDYETWFGGTPMTRAKRVGLRRNALIAATMWDYPRLSEIINLFEKDDELVLRETANMAASWVRKPPKIAAYLNEGYNLFLKKWQASRSEVTE